MDAGKRTISDIFNGNRKLIIPFFQRTYVWKEEQWARLIEDMEYISKTGKDYFLGSIILKAHPTPSNSSIVSIRRNAYCSGESSSLLLQKIEIL